MSKICGIYKITSSSNRVYIGQTVNFNQRKRNYETLDCKTQSKLHNSLLKYGWEAHNIKLIEECPVNILNERERYWQEYYNCLEEGLNCRLTTTENKSGHLSIDTKQKISKALKGKKQPNISKAKTGVVLDLETKQKISETNKKNFAEGKTKPTWLGKKLSESTKKKMSTSMKGRQFSDITKEKLRQAMLNKSHTKKKVIDIETGDVINSIKEACLLTKFSYHVFCNMLSGRTINKTKFKYYE
jgi:group I intron endonuclease